MKIYLFPFLLVIAITVIVGVYLFTDSLTWTGFALIAAYLVINLYFRLVRLSNLSSESKRLLAVLKRAYRLHSRKRFSGLQKDCAMDMFDGIYRVSVIFSKDGIFLDAAGTQLSKIFLSWEKLTIHQRDDESITCSLPEVPDYRFEIYLPRKKQRKTEVERMLEQLC